MHLDLDLSFKQHFPQFDLTLNWNILESRDMQNKVLDTKSSGPLRPFKSRVVWGDLLTPPQCATLEEAVEAGTCKCAGHTS